MFDQFHDPEFRTLVRAARAVITERVHRGVATPPERLAGAALDEMPDEEDPAAVRAWAPSAAFREPRVLRCAVSGSSLPRPERSVLMASLLVELAMGECYKSGATAHRLVQLPRGPPFRALRQHSGSTDAE